ncbi:MAG: exodeoxyribonuclease VII small subunit [Campylobacteraceae bacterium]|jgi:exodeoxyribonuclease VII small subunit|nr:exodeoxyribonuclease VII small subunit [Campylobacteraceae bacterium]
MAKTEKFEDKLEKAKMLLSKLSEPTLTLEDSMAYYKEGIKILKEASALLENAKQEFEILSKEKKL